ncbi:AAA-ATPase ASD, mitochondrial-like [Salvia miltiorrhiza]|uniref:AAA-ATPase ASD, mitochondrial-like n=1 Tax=Salvia miltiorrhiza TaxID=226208 RepID=UPI0025AC81C1|nr:AAA-ATPase ASD, mitochondrial-like [Salvia miltiorrhiza]
MFLKATFEQYLPHELKSSVDKHSQKLFNFFSHYIQIMSFNEFTGDRFRRSDVYAAIETYLSSTSATQVRRLKADAVRDSTPASRSGGGLRQARGQEPEVFLPTSKRRATTFLQPAAEALHQQRRRVEFEHPATFETLAMEPERKRGYQ